MIYSKSWSLKNALILKIGQKNPSYISKKIYVALKVWCDWENLGLRKNTTLIFRKTHNFNLKKPSIFKTHLIKKAQTLTSH